MKILAKYPCVLLFGVVLEVVYGQSSLLAVEKPNKDDSNYDKDKDDKVEIEYDEQAPVFIPSKAWQKILPGQALPAGLHYRINLETGIKEAKLLSEEDSVGVKPGSKSDKSFWKDESGKFNYLNGDDMATKLANLPDDGPSEETETDFTQFRPIEELKQDFAQMNQDIKTESEILFDLVSRAKALSSSESEEAEVLVVLADIEYYTHQIDNAQDFMLQYDGLNVLKRFLNDSSSDVKASVFKIFSATIQGNSRLRVYALREGLLELLLRILNSDWTSEPKSVALTRSVLGTLSALVRNFPLAQTKLFQMNAFDTICRVAGTSNDWRLQTKVLTLVTDIIGESSQFDVSETSEDLRLQYASVDAHRRLLDSCVCDLVSDSLSVRIQGSHDLVQVETVLNAADALAGVCEKTRHFWTEELLELREWLVGNQSNQREFASELSEAATVTINNISKLRVNDEL